MINIKSLPVNCKYFLLRRVNCIAFILIKVLNKDFRLLHESELSRARSSRSLIVEWVSGRKSSNAYFRGISTIRLHSSLRMPMGIIIIHTLLKLCGPKLVHILDFVDHVDQIGPQGLLYRKLI